MNRWGYVMTANKSSAMCFVHGNVCDHINIARS